MINKSQEYMICNAIHRCGGDSGKGLVTLQSELIETITNEGFTKQHAVKVLTDRYPKIFANEAWDAEEMLRVNMMFAEQGTTKAIG